ncbi:hypothetical protein CDL60_03260 [Roseateles noduli]|nr:hypothetical protein CDL60_03260 [Roseateles noduli]
MSAIVSGLIGGVISVAISSYIVGRVGRAGGAGQLRYGPFMWGLGIACLALSLLPVAATLFAGDHKEYWAKAGLFVGFGIGAIYCFGEAALVRGTFDAEEVRFSTPWTGKKHERWSDLESVRLNGWCNWYTLTFKSGAKIRLSQYLGGHLSALEAAGAQAR